MSRNTERLHFYCKSLYTVILILQCSGQVKSWLAADREKIDKSWFQEKNSKYLPKISQMFLSFINFPIKFISASTWVSRKCEPVCWVLAGHDTSLSTVTRDTCPHRRHDHWSPDVMFPAPATSVSHLITSLQRLMSHISQRLITSWSWCLRRWAGAGAGAGAGAASARLSWWASRSSRWTRCTWCWRWSPACNSGEMLKQCGKYFL